MHSHGNCERCDAQEREIERLGIALSIIRAIPDDDDPGLVELRDEILAAAQGGRHE